MNRPLIQSMIDWIEANPGCVDASAMTRPFVEDIPAESSPTNYTQRNSLISLALYLSGNPVVRNEVAPPRHAIAKSGEYAATEAMYALELTRNEMSIFRHLNKGDWPTVIEKRLYDLFDKHTMEILDTAAYGQALCTYLRWFIKNYPNVEI